MKDATLIRESYSEVRQFYLQSIADAAVEGNSERRDRLLERFRISESAFFVLFWGQFESKVNSAVIEMGECYTDFFFMERVGLCISAKHDFYKDIDRHYELRCDLAHGRFSKFPELNLPTVFDGIEEIVDAMDEGRLPLGDIFS